MKLFQQLLIAPAALGLLAPLAANADMVEYKGEDLSAGAFASATKMSGSAVFTNGFIDTAADLTDNKFTTEYNYKVDLNTSFTGSDNLYVGLAAGNQNNLVLDSNFNSGAANSIEVDKIHYTFPVGDFRVTAGPLLEEKDIISAKVTDYSSAFRLAEMPFGTEGVKGAGVGLQYVNTNGWNGSVNVLSRTGSADVATVGAFTEEGDDMITASVGYDAANYGGGIIYKNQDVVGAATNDKSIGAGIYFRPENFPTISLAIDKLDVEGNTNQTDVFVGIDHGVGDGTLSAAYQTRSETENNGRYEVYYNYPVNDGVSVQGGIFSEEVNGTADNTKGYMVETFFKF